MILALLKKMQSVEKILRAYIDETVDEEIIEETIEKQVTELEKKKMEEDMATTVETPETNGWIKDVKRLLYTFTWCMYVSLSRSSASTVVLSPTTSSISSITL